MRECPFPGDGEFSWQRFADVYNSELANNLGNLYSRAVTLITKNFAGVIEADRQANLAIAYWPSEAAWIDNEAMAALTPTLKNLMERCQYNQLLQLIWQQVLTPANQYAERMKPWELVKSDRPKAHEVLKVMVRPLYVASILLKPFLPKSAEIIYESFNFPTKWEDVSYDVASQHLPSIGMEYKVVAKLDGNKVKPLFPRIG
jgi:methionyl-tRNA synthetase